MNGDVKPGHMKSLPRGGGAGPAHYLLTAPALVLLIPFLVAPVLIVLRTSFATSPPGAASAGWTIDHYWEILTSGYYHAAFLRTVGIGAVITVLAFLLAMPLVYFILLRPKWRVPVLMALTGPLLVNVVARLFGWQLLLSDSGPINHLIAAIAQNSEPILFLGSVLGVLVVMLHSMLPYMTIALHNSVQGIDVAILEAARSLGANSWNVFLWIIIPLAIPGVITGSIIVFTLAASSFVVPAVIGGGKVNMFPTLVYLEAMALNFTIAAAIATCLLILLAPLSRLSGVLSKVGPQ